MHRGEHVRAGQLLFKLEKDPYVYKEASAKSKLAQAQASYEDKLTGKRLPYLKQIESDINGAKWLDTTGSSTLAIINFYISCWCYRAEEIS